MDEAKSRKEEIKSNIETKDEKEGREKLYPDIFIHGDNKLTQRKEIK